jgi:hypothetical protein
MELVFFSMFKTWDRIRIRVEIGIKTMLIYNNGTDKCPFSFLRACGNKKSHLHLQFMGAFGLKVRSDRGPDCMLKD